MTRTPIRVVVLHQARKAFRLVRDHEIQISYLTAIGLLKLGMAREVRRTA